MPKKRIILILSILITVGLLFVLLIQIEIKVLWQKLLTISFPYILLGFIFHFLAYLFRTLVYKIYFKNDDVSFHYLLSNHFIHNFYNHIIPANLGELSFPLLLKKKIPMSKSLSVLIITRLILLTLTLILFVVSLFSIPEIFTSIQIKESNSLIILGLLVVVILLMILSRRKLYRIIIKLKDYSFFASISSRFSSFYNKIKEQVIFSKKIKVLLSVTFYSLMSILCLALYFVTILKGINISLSIFEIIFVSSIGLAMIILPIKSIGGFGTFEGSWTIGLLILGIEKDLAIEGSFIVHIFALINVFFLFIIGIIIRHVTKGK